MLANRPCSSFTGLSPCCLQHTPQHVCGGLLPRHVRRSRVFNMAFCCGLQNTTQTASELCLPTKHGQLICIICQLYVRSTHPNPTFGVRVSSAVLAKIANIIGIGSTRAEPLLQYTLPRESTRLSLFRLHLWGRVLGRQTTL